VPDVSAGSIFSFLFFGFKRFAASGRCSAKFFTESSHVLLSRKRNKENWSKSIYHRTPTSKSVNKYLLAGWRCEFPNPSIFFPVGPVIAAIIFLHKIINKVQYKSVNSGQACGYRKQFNWQKKHIYYVNLQYLSMNNFQIRTNPVRCLLLLLKVINCLHFCSSANELTHRSCCQIKSNQIKFKS